VLQQNLEFGIKLLSVFLTQLCERKRLHASLGRPHGEEHGGFAANGGRADVEHDFHLDSFVERLLQVKKTTGDRKLMESRSALPAIFHPNQSENRSRQLDAWRARCDVRL